MEGWPCRTLFLKTKFNNNNTRFVFIRKPSTDVHSPQYVQRTDLVQVPFVFVSLAQLNGTTLLQNSAPPLPSS